jgi:hypothetical protein
MLYTTLEYIYDIDYLTIPKVYMRISEMFQGGPQFILKIAKSFLLVSNKLLKIPNKPKINL